MLIAWIFHGHHPAQSKALVTSSGVLELIWISAHSIILQDLMKTASSSASDQLRLRGMRAELCLANLASKQIISQDNNKNIQSGSGDHALDWKRFSKGLFYYAIVLSILIGSN